MDSFAVSVTSGVVLKPFRTSSALKIASFLALFQGAMPLIGWFIGREFQKYIQDYDHWVAFGVLLILGINMIREGRSKDEETPCCDEYRCIGSRGIVCIFEHEYAYAYGYYYRSYFCLFYDSPLFGQILWKTVET